MKLEDLDKLIPQYALNKSEFDSYKKLCDKENAQIKAIMAEFKKDEYPAGDYVASYSVSQRESINEEILLSLFTSVPSFVSVAEQYKIVKTKSYIDFDALEKALYDEALSKDQIMDIDKARETKEVVTLRIKKRKKQEDEE